MIHFDWSISLGQVGVVLAILAFLADWHQLKFRVGLMWADYKKRHQMAENGSGSRLHG